MQYTDISNVTNNEHFGKTIRSHYQNKNNGGRSKSTLRRKVPYLENPNNFRHSMNILQISHVQDEPAWGFSRMGAQNGPTA